MTDETRPDGAANGPQEQDDALDSWFRPRDEQEPQQRAPEGSGERARSAADSNSDDGAAGQDEALTQALRISPDNDATQLVMPKATDKSAPDKGTPDKSATAKAAPGENGADGDSADRNSGDRNSAAGDKTEKISRPTGDDAKTTPIPTGPSGAKTTPIPTGPDGARSSIPGANDRTQVIPAAVSPPRPYAASAPTQAIPRTDVPPRPPQTSQPPLPPKSDMAVRGGADRSAQGYGGGGMAWTPQAQQAPQQPRQPHNYPTPPGEAPILPVRAYDDHDDFDDYDYDDVPPAGGGRSGKPRKRRRGLLVGSAVGLVIAVVAALILTGNITVPGISAKPVPTVGFSPSGSDAGTDATQTGTAFLTAWQNGNLKAAANIADDPTSALAQLTAYKNDLKVSSLSVMPGTASTGGWMTFNVSAQVGNPASPWTYSSGMATYSKSIDGYTRWFVKWQPTVLFTSLKAGQKLGLGQIPPTANKVVDSHGTEITSANAPSLNGIVSALEKSAPPTDGTPGQKVQIENADGSVVSTVAKVSDPVNTSAVKTTLDLNVQAAAQSAVNQAPNSSMVVIQPSTGHILAVANNPTGGLDTAMVGHYAPGSTFKTVTTTLVLNKGVISDLNQTWDCPKVLNADGITLHNSEDEGGGGESFLTDFAKSCNNAFSRFESKVSRTELAQTAHDYYGFDQKWDVGLGQPTVYGHVPTSSSNSLAEELVGQDQITASPLMMSSVAATIANGSFKQPILVPGASQLAATALPGNTDSSLKTLMRAAVTQGTLAGVLTQSGAYGKTGTAEVQGKTPNSWTIAVHGDFAVAALAVGGNFGASTAGPECNSLLKAVS
ncbi:MAG TPA: penicillin-binding transpeptidase domain-containing protein [Actinocrinis sp.]|nr:penicillin-binding transpeptidase domain-containing protein [Actinocrinis sp.]